MIPIATIGTPEPQECRVCGHRRQPGAGRSVPPQAYCSHPEATTTHAYGTLHQLPEFGGNDCPLFEPDVGFPLHDKR